MGFLDSAVMVEIVTLGPTWQEGVRLSRVCPDTKRKGFCATACAVVCGVVGSASNQPLRNAVLYVVQQQDLHNPREIGLDELGLYSMRSERH
jgi:hypothetical protein